MLCILTKYYQKLIFFLELIESNIEIKLTSEKRQIPCHFEFQSFLFMLFDSNPVSLTLKSLTFEKAIIIAKIACH